jgi:hypothetical protein
MDQERATGAEGSNEPCGIIPLTLIDIFSGLAQKRAESTLPNEEWTLCVSYLEVYNEKVRDLFEPESYNLPVQEDPKSGIVGVGRLSKKPARNATEVMNLLRFGNTNRRTHSTDANATSSRSHAVLQLLLKQSWNNSAGKIVNRESRVNLIDLAGSERAGKTNNRGVRLQEGANINRSLLALANCINALSTKENRKNAKYRDSKLTHLLKSSLSGACKLIIIANINPSNDMFEDSHNTLKYANRAKCMKIDPKIVRLREQNMAWPLREQHMHAQRKVKDKENDLLKSQVRVLQDMLNGKCPILPDNGRDVLSNLKIQVADDSVLNTRSNNKPSPTHSCPGDRKSMYSKRRSSSCDIEPSTRAKPAPHRRRNSVAAVAPDPRLNIISEDSSVKNGVPRAQFDLKFDDPSNSDDEFDGGEGVKFPKIRSEKNLMDVSDISDISAHESILKEGFDADAPMEDRVGMLENRMMDMAQSRKQMLEFITSLQNAAAEAEAEKVEATERAEKAEAMIQRQSEMLERLKAQVELARDNAAQADQDRDEIMRKTGINFDDLNDEASVSDSCEIVVEKVGANKVAVPRIATRDLEVMGSGPSSSVSQSSRTPPRRSLSPASDGENKGSRPMGGRKIVSKHVVREAFGPVAGDIDNMRIGGSSVGGNGNGSKPVRKSSYPAGGRQAGLDPNKAVERSVSENSDPFSLQGRAFSNLQASG